MRGLRHIAWTCLPCLAVTGASTARDCNLNSVIDEVDLDPGASADPNGDGSTDISDGVFILRFLYLGGQTPGCLESTDADNQAAIDVNDAVFIFRFLFLEGSLPPAPGPATSPCGPDSDPQGSPGDLGCGSYLGC